MTTLREQLIVKIHDALLAITSIDKLKVERNRTDEVTHVPTVNLIAGDHTTDRVRADEALTDMEIEVECYAGGVKGAEADTNFNALYGAVHAALQVDPSLGGLAEDLFESGLFEVGPVTGEDGGIDYQFGIAAFICRFATDETDVTQLT